MVRCFPGLCCADRRLDEGEPDAFGARWEGVWCCTIGEGTGEEGWKVPLTPRAGDGGGGDIGGGAFDGSCGGGSNMNSTGSRIDASTKRLTIA